ncbi:MAG: S8 family serine peptidase [bacterium]
MRHNAIVLRGFTISTVLSVLIATPVFGIGKSKQASNKSLKQTFQTEIGKEGGYRPNMVVVKFKGGRNFGAQLSSTGIASVDEVMKIHQIYELERVYKGRPIPLNLKSSVSIRSIYYAYFEGDESPVSVARALNEHPLVEYAEPLYFHYLDETPDDPQFSQQNFFNIIHAPEAWDVVKGEQGNVVVAIVDGGTDIDHPDIAANLWTNPGEIPSNGIDDDNNGFVDDVNGWNFANSSNDPSGLAATPENADHGTHTAGIACAVTNNGVGVAGTSWNATLMPINAGNPTKDLVVEFGFEGVIYAASNGADIISLSWGGPIATSFGQDAIKFATDLGVAVVASAGNDNNALQSYPASFPKVINVAATDALDQKANFSNFGSTVDMAAPGVQIRSTINNAGYAFLSGTSFSTPMTAGVIALVKTLHPQWLGLQAAEQVRVTADNIDAVNPDFAGLLGRGRLNAFRAVSETTPSIRISDVSFIDQNGNGIIQAGESIEVLVTFMNYLAPASNVNLTLTENDPFMTLTSANASITSLGTLEETTPPVSFSFNVSPVAPNGRSLNFLLEITDGTYQDTDRFSLLVEPLFGTVAINNVDVSLNNVGRIGFATLETDPQSGGIGFKFNNGPNLLFEGAIIAGTGPNRISNAARGLRAGDRALYNRDFSGAEGGDFKINTPGILTDQESFAIFEDDRSNTPMNLRITQESFAETEPPNDDFVLLRYTIENQGQTALENFYFGFFFDWDIDEANPDNVFSNLANYDIARKLGYVSFSTTFVGASVVSSDGNISYRALDNNDPGPDFAVNDGFTDEEKWQAISSGLQVTRKGPADVSHVIATGPFTIEPNDFIQLGFALLAGEGLADLRANADAAQALWDGVITAIEEPVPVLPTEFSLKQNFPNPFNPTTFIRYEIAKDSEVELTIYNLLGQKIRTLVNERQNAGFYSIQWEGKNEAGMPVSSGVYLYRLKAGDFTVSREMVLLR